MTAMPPQIPPYRDAAQDKGRNLPPVEYLPPLKPRPKLFVALLILLICWLATIIVMRVTAVHRDYSPAAPSVAP